MADDAAHDAADDDSTHDQSPAGWPDLVGSLDYPMVLVTVHDGQRAHGCLVGFHTQCSIHPPRYLVLVSQQNRTWQAAMASERLGVVFLGHDQTDLARHFGELTGDEADKWDTIPHRMVDGAPIPEAARAWLVGRVVDRTDGGDHTAMVLEPVAVGEEGLGGQLMFRRVDHLDPGHQP